MLDTIMDRFQEHFTVSQVFGPPVERDGITVIPVATISGGGGGGSHQDEATEDGGGGFGGSARPAGVYEIRDGQVQWRPTVDVNRLAIAGAIVLSAFLLSRRRR